MRILLLALFAPALLAACGGDDAGPDAAAATCASYCSTITTNCSGERTQYTSMGQCLEVCEAFEQGSPGAMAGNNLECRNYHAGAALGDPGVHCVHAGPGGAGACGSNCEGFCQTAIFACEPGGANEAYASIADCMTACADFADDEPYDVSDTDGDTLACRIYHATVATNDPDTHCEHTLPVSDTCVDP